MARKEVLYWTACVVYGAILTGLLLYLRFPAEKFLSYCERYIEEKVPGISCSINDIRYNPPLTIVFTGVRITGAGTETGLFFEDPMFSLEPVWKNPLRLFKLRSTAFGGSHEAILLYDSRDGRLDFSEISIKGVELETISLFQERLERKVTGTLDIVAEATLQVEGLRVVAGEGTASIEGGGFALKSPILELSSIETAEGSVGFSLEEEKIVLTSGVLKNSQLDVGFAGNIVLTPTWLDSSLNLEGEIVPLAPLFQQKKQLRTIVTRMQEKYQKESLPYQVSGTLGRPTFVFGN